MSQCSMRRLKQALEAHLRNLNYTDDICSASRKHWFEELGEILGYVGSVREQHLNDPKLELAHGLRFRIPFAKKTRRLLRLIAHHFGNRAAVYSEIVD